MDFSFDDVQLELKRHARAWLDQRFPLDRDWDGPQDDHWGELSELGWLDVAEAGLGFVEEALLLEEMGYALYPGRYLAHVAGSNGSIELNGLAYGAERGEPVESVDPTRPLFRVDRANGSPETPRQRAAMAAEAVGVAQRALELGIVNWVVPRAALAEETAKLARKLADGPTVALGLAKRLIRSSLDHSWDEHSHREAESFAAAAATQDHLEGVSAFVEKRQPVFRGR